MVPYLQDARLVYKTYATLYFVFIFDSAENELAMLDLMQGTWKDYPQILKYLKLLQGRL